MFKWIILFIIFIAAVKYFDIDVRGIIESSIVQDTLNTIINILVVIWSFVKVSALYILGVVKSLL